jgi:hypothetical protein
MKSLSELCEAPKLRKAEVGTVPYIEIGDVDVVSKLVNLKDKPAVKGSVLAPAPSLLVSRVRPTRGAITLLNGTQAVSSAFLALQPKAGTNLRLLFYWLAYSDDFRAYLEGAQIGSLYPSVREEDILKYRVNYPSDPAEQQRIVRLLDEAFEGIAIAKANAEKNIKNAQELFKSHLRSVFTQSGNGWTDRALEEICSVSAGNSAPQDPGYVTEGTIPFFRTSDAGRIKFGTIYESQDKLNSHGASKLRRYPAGTILFPKSGASTFLNHRVVLGVEGCVSSHLATIVPDLDHVLPQFLLYALTLIDAKDLIQDQSYPSLNLPAIENIRIYLPPLDEQQQVVHLLDELQVITDKLARICSAKQASLEDLKESLLHQAFSGNLEAA